MSAKDSGAAVAVDKDGRRHPIRPSRYADVNAVVGGYLRDLPSHSRRSRRCSATSAPPPRSLPSRCRSPIWSSPMAPTPDLGDRTRVIREILETGESPTVDRALDGSDRRADIARRRRLRCITISVRLKFGACSRIRHLRGPLSSSTAAICKCTPNGATGHASTLLGRAVVEEVAELRLRIEAHRHAAFAIRDRNGELIHSPSPPGAWFERCPKRGYKFRAAAIGEHGRQASSM
jgi:hypothetical protein